MRSTTVSRQRPNRTVDAVGVVAVVLGMLLGLVPGIAPGTAEAAHGDLGAGQFEIDGDISGVHDWEGLGGEQPSDGTGNTDLSFFKASLTEASYPDWDFVTGANAPKADLHRLFVNSQLSADGNFVWLGATRVSDVGNVQVTTEFNRNTVTLGSLTGAYREAGDIFIRFNFPGNTGAPVDAYVAQWTGSAWGPETQLTSGTDFRSATGTLGVDSREFVELEIDLSGLFGEGNEFACGSFGAVSFRTEASGGNNDNNDPTLKDVAGPFPIDLDTCGQVTVEKVDADGNPLAGAEFTLYEGSDPSGTVVATCTTDATGGCSFGPQQTGTYTIDETGVPAGYGPADGLPETFAVVANTPVELGPYTDPILDYSIAVQPDGRNAVGNEHVFTVSLGGSPDADLTGQAVGLEWTGAGAITGVNGGAAASSCITDDDAECTVTVLSDAPGSGTLVATFATPYQHTVAATGASATDGQPLASIQDSGEKVWIGYRAELAADGLNLLGDAHTFTATVYEVDEVGEALAAGVTVTVAWDGPAGSTIDGGESTATCVTDASGTCTVEVDSDTDVGTGTASIVELSGVVGDEEALVVTHTVGADGTPAADKTWREYRASIDDDSTNPAGQHHTFNVTVEYRDAPGDSWQPAPDDTVVQWTFAGDGRVVQDDETAPTITGSTCDDGTTGGDCTIVVTHTTTGTGTVTLTGVSGALLGEAGASDESYAVADAASKTWREFVVDIDPAAVNLVGDDHTFAVRVQYTDDGSTYQPVSAGTTVVFSTVDGPDDVGTVVATDCDVPGTGDDPSTGAVETNVCFITVGSDTPGTLGLVVSGIGQTTFPAPDRTELDIAFEEAGETSKTWIDHRVSIDADSVNLVGEDHTFTVTAEQDSGSGWGPVPAGTVVGVSEDGVGSIDVAASSCDDGTDAQGRCTVVVTSGVPGTSTVTVTSVQALAVDGQPVVAVAATEATTADKTWIDYDASIEASATNLVGDPHTFTVTAVQDSGDGWGPVPDGTTVGWSTDNDGTVLEHSCDATDDGSCTITVVSSAVDSVTVTVDSVSAEDVDGDPTAEIAAAEDTSATKTWVAVRVDVEQDAINVVGDAHTFTVDVDVLTPTGTVPAADGTVVTVSASGVGAIESQTCDAPGTSGGSCEVTVDASVPGDLTVTVDAVAFTHDGTDFVVDLTDDSTSGEAAGQDRDATKTWRAYRVDIEADGLNLVRDQHVFTVTVEQTDDGESWTDVPDGTTLSVYGNGLSTIQAGASTCLGSGTVDGECTVTVTSDGAGTTTVGITAIASTTIPEEERAEVDIDVATDTASKTWVAFRATISDDSVNVTGDDHDFTLGAEYTVDGSTWQPVPDGSSIGFTSDGVGSVSGADCDSTVDGACTVTVDSAASGDRTVTVTGVGATITHGGLTEGFAVTLTDGASGVLVGADTDVTATKTWASYALELTPAEAVNLLDGTQDDPEQDHVITAILTSDDAQNAPVGGQDVEVVLDGDTGVITAVEDGAIADGGLSATCTTTDDGTCDVTISSSTPGTATLSGSFQAAVGESDPLTVTANDAVKLWTTYRVTVTPEQATNLVGNPHVFTVLVEQSDAEGAWQPVGGVVPSIRLSGDGTISDSTCGDGTFDDGTCLVIVTSDVVSAVTLTAEYEASVDETTAVFTDAGDKDWIDFDIDVDPDTDENLVGTEHVFTVTVTTTFPVEGGTVTQPVPGAVPTVELTGLGAISDDGCAAGTDADGQCEVTITSGAAGSSTLTASHLGSAADDEEVREYTDSGAKLWVEYALAIDPQTAVNAVGDDHEFTATLTVDTGGGFGPAAGETLAFTVTGVGAVTGGDVDLTTLECTTDELGECDIVIDSDETGTTDVGVSYDAVAGATSATLTDAGVKQWVDIDLVKTAVVGDGLADGDLVLDAEIGIPTLFFSTSAPEPQVAVYEFTLTNTGPAPLTDVVLTDDRLGVVIDAADGVSLAPGESTTVRAQEVFTIDDASGGLDNFVTNTGLVTASGDDGTEVSDTDDAVIQLVAQQSSILIDLVKEAVIGAGDLVEDADGLPSISWTGDEFDAGATRTVRYRFTIANVGPSTIVDIELTDDMISDTPIVAVGEGLTLAPGESTVIEVDHQVVPEDAFPESPGIGEGTVDGGLLNVATVRGANEARDAFDEDTDDQLVLVTVVRAELIANTGLGNAGALLPLSVLLISIGTAVLWLDRRRGGVMAR